MNDMEKAIVDIIEKKYNCKYTGGITVTKLGKGWAGYKLKLDLGNTGKNPVQISADLEAEDFLKFIEKEIVSRQLCKVDYFRGIKIEPDEEGRTCC